MPDKAQDPDEQSRQHAEVQAIRQTFWELSVSPAVGAVP
jgi:hypothetical protein